MRKRNILVMLLCIISMLYGLSGTYPYAAAKSRSSYTRKEMNVFGKDKYGNYINMAQYIDLSYNQKYKLCTLYAHEDRKGVVTNYVRSWSAKGKVSDRKQKNCNEEYDVYVGTKIDDDGTIYSLYDSWTNHRDERKGRFCIKFNAVNAKGKLLSHFRISKFDTDIVGHFYDPGPVGKYGRNERYRLEDFEIDGDYVDYIIVRSDFGGYDYADFMKGTVKYSLQRVNWKSGEIVSFHELPRPCQKLCGGFPYGTDMNSFYKYSKDGRECLWENMLPEGKASLGKRSRDVLKQKYCVTEGKLFYANVNGVYMLSTLENNSAPQRLITARECPALKDGLSIVVQILAVNEKCFYMTVSGENGRPDYLFRYRKR